MAHNQIAALYHPDPDHSARGKFNQMVLDPLVDTGQVSPLYISEKESDLFSKRIFKLVERLSNVIQYRRVVKRAASRFDIVFVPSQ